VYSYSRILPLTRTPERGFMKREKTKYKGIYKVGEIYYITYYVGSKKYEKKVGPRLKDALQEKMDREAKIKRGKYEVIEKQEKMTFNQLFKLYGKEGDRKEYILRPKQIYLDYFAEWKLAHITRKDLFAFRDKVKETPKQIGGGEVTNAHVNRILAGLRRLFSFAVNRELMEASPFPTNPKSGLFYPEKKGFRRFFTQDQIIKIVTAADEWLKPIILTAYYTGMRMGEIRKLRWEHVDLAIGVINLPSSKTLRDPTGLGQRIVMQKDLMEIFQNLPKRSEWVFSKADGIPYTHAQLFKAFRNILVLLGIDVKQYSLKELRHTTGSIMNIKGADPMAIKDQLRHTDFKTTQDYYIGSDIEYQREQVEKLALERPKAEA